MCIFVLLVQLAWHAHPGSSCRLMVCMAASNHALLGFTCNQLCWRLACACCWGVQPFTTAARAKCGCFIDQVKKTLGWEPVVPLKEGLALMVEDFAHRLGECTVLIVQTHLMPSKHRNAAGAHCWHLHCGIQVHCPYSMHSLEKHSYKLVMPLCSKLVSALAF